MLITPALFATVVVAGIGVLIAWSNPRRNVNRVVFTCSVNLSLWLWFLHLATRSTDGLFWLRCACATGAFVPLHFWIVKESIANDAKGWMADAFVRFLAPGLMSGALAFLPFTEYFIPSHSTATTRLFGWGYYAYIWLNLAQYIVLLFDTFRTSRRLAGGRRLELQVWLLGGCFMTTLIFALMALNALTHNRIFIRLQPIVVLVFYAGTVFAITANRIFDARQLLLVAVEKSILVGTTTYVAYLADLGLGALLPHPFDFLATIAIALTFASNFNGWLDRKFLFYPQATNARQAIFDAARREAGRDSLEKAFLSVLKGWGQTDHALVLSGTHDQLSVGAVETLGAGNVVQTMRQLRWATPERLIRERPTPERDEVSQFMRSHGLGALVIGEGPTLTCLIGVGVAGSRRPFTYPQVTQLVELASIMESALERAHFAVKAQHAEQLATVGLLGASLAHEIRNPLVSIKTFVQLLPNHYQDRAFRDKFFKLIGDEVTRIDRLTEQLLDLASPRVYTATLVDLHPVVRAGIDLAASKASGRNIELRHDLRAAPDRAWTDAAAVKQVLLNLCFNAIQAVEMQVGERWVLVSTRNTADGIELSVADSGPGIATEIRPRLFQPFQSTKSSGFGLGLAICKDILGNLSASITVDPPASGHGAVFRVVFPCRPS